MQNALRDILAYIVDRYPEGRKVDLTVARLRNMLFLADWRAVLTMQHPIANVRWTLTPFGPSALEVEQTIRSNQKVFALKRTMSHSGRPRHTVGLANDINPGESLPGATKETLQFVIAATCSFTFDQLIKFVYSTYPILKTQPDCMIDLPVLAQEYRVERASIAPVPM